MFNKYILLSILIIGSVFSSGCLIDNNNNAKANQSIGPDFIPKTNLPPGFTYMGVHEITIKIAGASVAGFEGVYRYNGEDIYIQAFKNDNPETLLTKYKADLRSKFKEDYNPFEDITINAHASTKFTEFRTMDGKSVPRYNIIWANKGYMIQVGSFDDINPVVVLASATGY